MRPARSYASLLRKHPPVAHPMNGYSDAAFDQNKLIANARRVAQENPDFAGVDTLIGSGMSGSYGSVYVRTRWTQAHEVAL